MSAFPPLQDEGKFNAMAKENPTLMPYTECMEKYISNPLPPFTATSINGLTTIFINKAEHLEDFYVKKNMYYSKSWLEIATCMPVFRQGPLVQRTEDPGHAPLKKILTGAFFKKNLAQVLEIIKSSTITHMRKVRSENKNGQKVDAAAMSCELISSVVTNICIGDGAGYVELDYESLFCDEE